MPCDYNLPLAYDKVVCSVVRLKAVLWFAYPAAYSTLVYARGHEDMKMYCIVSKSSLLLGLLTGNEQWFRLQILLISACCLLARASMQMHAGCHFQQVLLHELRPSGVCKSLLWHLHPPLLDSAPRFQSSWTANKNVTREDCDTSYMLSSHITGLIE